MATGWIYLNYLQSKGVFLEGRAKVLDIGAQHLFDVPLEGGRAFLRSNGCTLPDDKIETMLESLEKRSKWPSWGLYLEEFLSHSTIDYTAYDIFSGARTRIFDLNFESLAEEHVAHFDVVMNFGTTEHVFNQYNSFKVIHEACKVSGYMFHQVPAAGYVNHGYWIYSPKTFTELAHSNGYSVLDVWITGPQGSTPYPMIGGDLNWDPALPENNLQMWSDSPVPNGLINVLLRKNKDAPFRLALEISTAAAAADETLFKKYE